MARPKKRVSRGSKAVKGKSSRSSKSVRKGKTKARAEFTSVWKQLGSAVLRAAEADCGWDREALAAKLRSDAEIQKLLIEKTIGLFRLVVWPASELGSIEKPPVAQPSTPSSPEQLADEYALGVRTGGGSCVGSTCDHEPAEAKADWRAF
jgi:hypothetical protein